MTLLADTNNTLETRNLLYFLLRPRYWLGLLLFAIAKLIAVSPLAVQRLIGRSLGWTLYHLYARHKKIVEINLRLCFPELTEKQTKHLILENAYMTGHGVIETCAAWFSSLSSRHKVTTITGLNNIEKAISEGNGVILLGFHMTSLEIGTQLLAKHIPITGMYKPDKNPLIEYFMVRGRLRHMTGLIQKQNTRRMLKSLKKNQVVWYAADQDYGIEKTSVFAPFFGIPASTITATTKFTRLTGAKVIPFTQKRVDGGKSYQLVIHPALENFPGANELADATRLNGLVEQQLRSDPSDYFWVHKRFKTRPEGEKSFYS